MDTLDSRHLMCLIEQDRKVPNITDTELVRFVKYNLEVLESGVHPHTDYMGRPLDNARAKLSGKPLANGWRASFWGWQGDIKEKVKQHKFSRNWQCNFLCERCLGCRHLQCGNAYDFRESALWRQLPVDHTSYLRSTSADQLSPWAMIPSWRIDRNTDDLLHMIWLGFGKDVIGQLLFDLAILHPSLEEGLIVLSQECRSWYRARKIPFSMKPWNLNTISVKSMSRDYPTFESKQKGANTKLVFLWLSAKCVELVNSGTDMSGYARLRAEMCWCLSNVLHLFDRAGHFLTRDAAREAHKDGNRFLVIYTHLASVALQMEIAAFKVLPTAQHSRSQHRT
jgi:hypothetical protein